VALGKYEPLLSVEKLDGGLNLVGFSNNIDKNEASDMLNCVPDKVQGIFGVKKALGNVLLATMTQGITGIYEATYNTGTVVKFVVGTTKVWTVDATYTPTLIHTFAVSDTRPVQFEMFNAYTVILKPGNNPIKVTSAGVATALTGWPPAPIVTAYPTFMAIHENYLFMGGCPQYPDTLFHCEPDALDTWNAVTAGDPTGAGWFTLPSGAYLKGLQSLYSGLYIFTTQGIYCLNGKTVPSDALPDPFTLTQVYKKMGQAAPNAITCVENDILYFDNYSIKSLAATQKYGDVEQSTVSNKITTLLNTIAYANIPLVFSKYFPDPINQVWFVIKSSSSSYNYILIYDTVNGSFWGMNYGVTALCKLTDDTIISGRSDGRIVKENTGNTRIDANYNFLYKTGWFSFKDYLTFDMLTAFTKLDASASMFVDFYIDYNENVYYTVELKSMFMTAVLGAFILGLSILGASMYAENRTDRVPPCKALKIGFRTTGNDSPVSLLGFNLYGG